MTVFNLGQTAQEATRVLRTFTDGQPDLIKTGLPGVDRVIGGLFPGTAIVLGADTGIGKSSTMLAAAMTAAPENAVGILSLEDTVDVLGTRAISLRSGVDSLAIRRKQLSSADKDAILCAIEELAELPVHITYAIGGRLAVAELALEELSVAGCRMVYVDYLQKMRGGGQDRRNEVATGFTFLQAKAAELGMAICFISQVARRPDMSVAPRRWHLKESGDLENEARCIVMLHREDDIISGLIDKSTVGGEGTRFRMKRTSYGLQEVENPIYANVEDF